jgi:hypothetical protein
MKKIYFSFASLAIAAFFIFDATIVKSKITSPPAGTSGDPITNSSCAAGGCHPSPAVTPTSSDLALTIGTGTPTTSLNSSFKYAGSEIYNINFGITSFTGRYGFQMVALDASNNQAGTFAATNAATTKRVTSVGTGTREYMGHLNANATKNWTFRWTSPATTTGNVTFYYAFVTADNNNQSSGDVVYKGSVTISPESASAIEPIDTKLSNLSIMPNPVNNQFAVSFDLLETNKVSAQLYSIDGRLVQELMNEQLPAGNCSKSFDANELNAGIYLVKLNIGQSSVTKKIVKL